MISLFPGKTWEAGLVQSPLGGRWSWVLRGLEVSDLLKDYPASLRVSAHTANLLFQDNWLTVSRDYFQANLSCPLVL